ncbi:MAG: hydrogenase maturation protein HypF [Pseudonocardiales bacterium]|nr:hydrogenase maturation protein HypF [Pseudonocardiales bacterium]
MTATVSRLSAARVRRRFLVRGVVQGVGFRPFVYARAVELSLSGSVHNDSAGVVIEVEGAGTDVEQFARRLSGKPPPLAIIDRIETEELAPRGGSDFVIGDSELLHSGRTLTPPDIATCEDCLRELSDPSDRRYRHPFITCTNCGPRFTIITGLPYDRPATTMARFAMCAACTAEYRNPADRRFHAQPIACPDCGPRLELIVAGRASAVGEAALGLARRGLAAGLILAVKGIGGYHLACDAGNERAVSTLRERKARGDKPFAVMVRDVETVRALTRADAAEIALIASTRRPIVLVRRGEQDAVAASVAPGNPDLGMMLPYTPLHTLLFGLGDDETGPRALVMTSGNVSGEPIVFDDDDALVRLAPLADGFLRHDRAIHVPVDDSVSRIVDGAELPIRRSRGYAPLPVALPFKSPAILAVGADLKNACCVGKDRYAWLSQHIGDMDDLRTLEAFSRTVPRLQELAGVQPNELAADAHPAYRSSRYAQQIRGERRLETVQHHHAHIASVMVENGWDGRTPVIGFAFDGTGYGTDGAIWGGELLIADYARFARFAHLDYVPLAGGDAAVRRPYRMALAHLHAAGVPWSAALPCVLACPEEERLVLAQQLSSGFGCVPTSSMGRLFDAISSLAGIRQVADYEAQAAIELEGRSREARNHGTYRYPVDGRGVIDSGAIIRAVADDVLAGVPAETIAGRFHAATISLIVELAVRAREELNLNTVAMSGGVFQNATLLAGACTALRQVGFSVLRHRIVPPNDGGIALGQLAVAAARSSETRGGTSCV